MVGFTKEPVSGVEDLLFATYQLWPGISQSLIKLYDRDSGGAPAKYRYVCEHPLERPEPSDAMEFGSAYHSRVLTPAEFAARYVICTGEAEAELLAEAQSAQKGKKSEKFSKSLGTYKAWRADHEAQGRKVITQAEADRLSAMTAALLECREVREIKLFDDCAYEVSLFAGYKLPDGNQFQLKGRLDILPQGDAIVDLKTARAAHPKQFARAVADMSLDIQAAFYLDLANANGMPKKRFGFLAQDKDAPYLAAIHWMPDEWVHYGRQRYKKVLLDIAESIRINHWPGYESGVLQWPTWLDAEIGAAV